MTETALNERIAELQENDSETAHQRQKVRRRLRRITGVRKTDYLLRIINYGGYAPHRGYIDWGFSGRTLLHTGEYIKYPKNSNCQRWIKRETSRRIRKCSDVPVEIPQCVLEAAEYHNLVFPVGILNLPLRSASAGGHAGRPAPTLPLLDAGCDLRIINGGTALITSCRASTFGVLNSYQNGL